MLIAMILSRVGYTDSVEGAMYRTGNFSLTFLGTKNRTGCYHDHD